MDDEEDVAPKLGKSRARDSKKIVRYGARIVAAARLAGRTTSVRSRRFDGSRMGRGASIGRVLSSRDRFAGIRARRAIVKTRLVRLGAKGLAGARAHLRYIQRDGVTREGAPGQLYGPATDQADGKAFLERSAEDRHQFRFIVSAEDGAEYPDLKPYIRRLMAQAEHDLGTRLDWVAVDHFNTDNPHTHIMLRGVDDQRANLIIAREYIAHGLRERAAELASIDLGPRTDREIEDRLRHDVTQERLTAIDRQLVRRMDADRVVTAASNDPFQHSMQAGRLRRLGAMGLAEDLGQGRWRLADDVEETLRRMGECGDIIRTMQRELTARNLDCAGVDRQIHDVLQEPVIGRVIHRGLADEHRDRHYLIVDGIDGRVHYINVGRGDLTGPAPEGSIVRVSRAVAEIKSADRVIDAVARSNGGIYSIEAHLRHDPTATQTFAEAHVRRLEALRRSQSGVERRADGRWTVASDYLERAAAYEAARVRAQPVVVDTLSLLEPAKLERAEAATWLDRELGSATPLAVRDVGFGRELRASLSVRRQWLIEQDLAEATGNSVRLCPGALETLRDRELAATGASIAAELRKPFSVALMGDRFEGRLSRRVDLLSGRYAVVDRGHDFTLVPWRPMLERKLGQRVGGLMRTNDVEWTFGRGRSGPQIS